MKPEYASKYTKLVKGLTFFLAIAIGLGVWFTVGEANKFVRVAFEDASIGEDIQELV